MQSSVAVEAVPLEASTAFPLKLRLYGMMFLQYFIQGCYLPVIAVYLQDALGFTGSQKGYFVAAIAVGPLVAPFILGQLVDRHLAMQRVLAFCHLAAGVTMLALYWVASSGASQGQGLVWTVIGLGSAYSLLYVPSMMLTNSLALKHLVQRDREFPRVRLWGTIGFIVPAWLIELYFLRGMTGEALNQARGITLALSGLAGLAMAVYAMSLPHTPPERERRGFAPGKVVGLLRFRHFLVLVLVTLAIAMVHNFYFTVNSPFIKAMLQAGGVEGAYEQRISSLGQISEIAVMALLGLLIARLGFKWTMLIGASAYLARCLVLAGAAALGEPFTAVMLLVGIGQALHGLCFGCFLAAAFMYVDRMAPSDARGSMQTFYGTLVVGAGLFLGGLLAGRVEDFFRLGTGEAAARDWSSIWLTAAALAAAALAAFALAFPSDRQPAQAAEVAAEPA